METEQKKSVAGSPTPTAPVTVEVIKDPVRQVPAGFQHGGAGRSGGQRSFNRDGRDAKKNPRRGGSRDGRVKSEFDQKIINIRRVTRVAAGERRFSFSVALVAGNRKGSVGVGIGKAGDTSLAIDKALKNAKKNLVKLALTKTMSIPHDVSAKYSTARVYIMPAKGRGLTAGSAVRNVLELAGVTDVTAKILSPSKNRLNIARVAVKALSQIMKKRPLAAK